MSSKTVVQHLEKEILKRSLHGIWTNGERIKSSSDKNVVFEIESNVIFPTDFLVESGLDNQLIHIVCTTELRF